MEEGRRNPSLKGRIKLVPGGMAPRRFRPVEIGWTLIFRTGRRCFLITVQTTRRETQPNRGLNRNDYLMPMLLNDSIVNHSRRVNFFTGSSKMPTEHYLKPRREGEAGLDGFNGVKMNLSRGGSGWIHA